MFEPLARFAPRDRTLVFYDPSGAGQSDRPTDVAWDIELFVDELAALIAELRLPQFHLLGASFGGTVALAFAARRPVGLASVTVVGASHSYPLTRARSHEHIHSLHLADPLLDPAFPPWGAPCSAKQARAVHEYTSLFICRVALPDGFARAVRTTNFDAMNAMKGPSFLYDGNLRDFDLPDSLVHIDVPTLVASGQHDPFLPIFEQLHARLANSRFEVFAMSSHMPQLEQPADFARMLFAYVTEHDPAVVPLSRE
jgi:proline iminopeptidase